MSVTTRVLHFYPSGISVSLAVRAIKSGSTIKSGRALRLESLLPFLALLLGLALVSCSGSSGDNLGGSVQPVNSIDSSQAGAATGFTTFESGQVRPMVLSNDSTELYVANTPNSTLEIFDVTTDGLQHKHSVSVGLEPVALGIAASGDANGREFNSLVAFSLRQFS